MGAGVDIVAPEGLPDVGCRVSSFAYCEGNILMNVQKVGFDRLDHLNPEDQIEALKTLITEIDKGDEGIFDDDFWVECDMKWSKGKEFTTFADDMENVAAYLNKTVEQMWGDHRRHQNREDAVLFLLSLLAGYKLVFSY